MANIKLNLPARLIESARQAQYDNRSRVNNRQIQDEVKRRIQIKALQDKKSKDPTANITFSSWYWNSSTGKGLIVEGGQLEFKKKEQYKIWTNRRQQLSGWLLIPSADFIQNKLKGFPYSEKDIVVGQGLKYIGNAIEYSGDYDTETLGLTVTSVTIDPLTDYTVEFLVRLAKTGVEDTQPLSFTGPDGSTNTYPIGYSSTFDFVSLFYNALDSGIRFQATLTSGVGWTIIMGKKLKIMNIVSGKVYHVAFTVSGNKVTSFFDGELFDSFTVNEKYAGYLWASVSFSGRNTTWSTSGVLMYAQYVETYERTSVLNQWGEQPNFVDNRTWPFDESGTFYSADGLRKVVITTLGSIYQEQLSLSTTNASEAGNGFSGLRFTIGEILYRGQSFQPPESITSLV